MTTGVSTATVLRRPYGVAALAGAALAADVAFDPVHTHVPLCPFHAVTGLWCPLCGGLRAADSLAHVHVTAALHDNLLFLLALPFAAVWWLDWVLHTRTGRPSRTMPRHAGTVLVIVAVAFAVLRNLPFVHGLRPG
jgi:Protein of unknown function (DUF2752)